VAGLSAWHVDYITGKQNDIIHIKRQMQNTDRCKQCKACPRVLWSTIQVWCFGDINMGLIRWLSCALVLTNQLLAVLSCHISFYYICAARYLLGLTIPNRLQTCPPSCKRKLQYPLHNSCSSPPKGPLDFFTSMHPSDPGLYPALT